MRAFRSLGGRTRSRKLSELEPVPEPPPPPALRFSAGEGALLGWGWGKRTVRQNSISPPPPPSPLLSLFFIWTLKMLQARAAEKHPSAPTSPGAESRAGVQLPSSFGAGRVGREDRGVRALRPRGQAPGWDRASSSSVSGFTSSALSPPLQAGAAAAAAGRRSLRLCSPTPGPPASCRSRLGARNHNNSHSYHHHDAGKRRH